MWYVPGVSRWFNWFKYVAMFNLILVGGFNPPEKYESNSKSSPIFAGWTFQQNMHLKPLTLSDFSRFTLWDSSGSIRGNASPASPSLKRFTSRGAELSPHRSASESDRTKVLAPAIFPLRMLRNVKDIWVWTCWNLLGFLLVFFCVRWPFCWDDSPVEGCWWFRNYGMKKSRWITWLALFVVFFGISQHRW